MTLAQEILELFEDYLEEKNVVIDNPEREGDDGAALIYGTEYGYLEDKINEILNGKNCRINTYMGGSDGILNVNDGEIFVYSEDLDEYLQNYSME